MVTGVILAGGASSRMGRGKPFLPIGAHTLIELVMQRLRPFVERVVIIGNAHNVHRLRDTLSADAILMDAQPGYGPLMGIYTGLLHTETLLNLFVPCDMPWVERGLVNRLLDCCRQGVDVVASRLPLEGVQPFPLVCQTTAARTIGALLDRGERSLQALLHQPGAQLIEIDEPALWRSFTNVNTLSDYAKLTDPFDFAQGHGERVKRVEP
jgi:molybdopterin-guanine dinucleotide biosynthesis protein A